MNDQQRYKNDLQKVRDDLKELRRQKRAERKQVIAQQRQQERLEQAEQYHAYLKSLEQGAPIIEKPIAEPVAEPVAEQEPAKKKRTRTDLSHLSPEEKKAYRKAYAKKYNILKKAAQKAEQQTAQKKVTKQIIKEAAKGKTTKKHFVFALPVKDAEFFGNYLKENNATCESFMREIIEQLKAGENV